MKRCWRPWRAESRISRNSRVDARFTLPCGDPRPLARSSHLVADCDEIDELFDGVDEGRLDIPVRRDGFQDPRPEASCFEVQSKALDHAFFPRLTPGHLGPGCDADGDRFDRLPDVDVWVAAHENVGVSDALGNPGLFRSFDQVIEENTEPVTGSRSEAGDGSGEIVRPVERFDHDGFFSEVVTPDLFEQLCVVDAFDPDSTRSGNPCTG